MWDPVSFPGGLKLWWAASPSRNPWSPPFECSLLASPLPISQTTHHICILPVCPGEGYENQCRMLCWSPGKHHPLLSPHWQKRLFCGRMWSGYSGMIYPSYIWFLMGAEMIFIYGINVLWTTKLCKQNKKRLNMSFLLHFVIITKLHQD